MGSDTVLGASDPDGEPPVMVAPADQQAFREPPDKAHETPQHALPRFDPHGAAADGLAALPDAVLDRVFRSARTPARWSDKPVPQSVLHALYDLVKLGPTSANCSPARFVFLESRDSRARLGPALSPGNLEPTMQAAITVIIAHDPLFYEQLPRLYPQTEARSWFAVDIGLAEETAFRNASLQGGYLILAARMLGLDAWPMSGFDNARVDEIFFTGQGGAGQGWRSNFLVNLGHADGLPEMPRGPRLAFDEACLLL